MVVTASPSGAASCRLRGHALTGITCKAQHTLSLAVYDSFDNPRYTLGIFIVYLVSLIAHLYLSGLHVQLHAV